MMKTKVKKPILIGIISAALVAIAVILLLLLPKKDPNPRALLAEADTLSAQNLCLAAMVKADPADEASWRQLLTNYQLLGADPLTIEATRQASGFEIVLPEEVTVQKEEPGALLGMGGILQDGKKITDYKGANALATDGEMVYLAREDGIYADYHGIEIKLTPAKAERMIAAENGLYFLNATARRVQYIARDGHRIETLSELPAVDFAFFNDILWIAGADGVLYKNGAAVKNVISIAELCAAEGKLYAAGSEGLMEVTASGAEMLLPSPLSGIVSGKDGCIYYIDQNSFPAKFDPALKEASILKTKTAIAIDYDGGKIYYLNEKHKIKGC